MSHICQVFDIKREQSRCFRDHLQSSAIGVAGKVGGGSGQAADTTGRCGECVTVLGTEGTERNDTWPRWVVESGSGRGRTGGRR